MPDLNLVHAQKAQPGVIYGIYADLKPTDHDPGGMTLIASMASDQDFVILAFTDKPPIRVAITLHE